jgi:osomolarity two-component system sensor histidine kinase SLN1
VFIHRPILKKADDEDESGEVDEVVVDRAWSEDIKSTVVSEYGGAHPERSNSHGQALTNTDHDSLAAWTAHGFWGSCMPLIILRYRLWPTILNFFSMQFEDKHFEKHFRKEGWFFHKSLALGSAVFFIINWYGG